MNAMAKCVAMALVLFGFGCGGGGLATRSAGNISISAGDNAVVTISHSSATQEAQKTVDAGKIAANAAVTGQGTAGASGTPTITTAAPAPEPAPAVARPIDQPDVAAPDPAIIAPITPVQ